VIVDSIHSGLITADASGRLLYVNNFGQSILGVRTADVRGRTLRELLGSPLLEHTALQARASLAGLARLELVYPSPAGTALDLGGAVSHLAPAEPGGGYLLVFQNLTDVKRLEREVRIKEKLAAVGEMAAQLAHEIRNPLGSISGSAQVLLGEANMS